MSNQPSNANEELQNLNYHVIDGSPAAEGSTVGSLTEVKENYEKNITNEINFSAEDSISSENSHTLNKSLENTGKTNSDQVDTSKEIKNLAVFYMKKGVPVRSLIKQPKNPINLGQQSVPSKIQSNISSGKQQIINPQMSGVSVQPLVSGNNRIQVATPINIIGKIPDVSSSNNSLNINTLPLNILTSPNHKTTVKQPNDGPCMCFVCGQNLLDPTERICYSKKQKLCNTQFTLLELLSDILTQTVVTNTDSVDLCSTCSELINETDNALSHVNRLKKQINAYFTNNQRPKLTYQVFPKNTNFGIVPCGNISQKNSQPSQPPQPPQLNLDDLAAERLKRRNQNRKKKVTTEKKNSTNETLKKKSVKKKGYTLEKLYACNICKQKFLKKDIVIDHMIKEHEVQPASVTRFNPARSTRNPNQTHENNKEQDTTIDSIKKEFEEKNTEKASAEIPKNNTKIVSNANNTTKMQSKANKTTIIESKSITSSENISIHTSKCESAAASQLLAAMKPIQPKPPNLVQTTSDGSVIFFMNPTVADSVSTVIKVSTGNTNTSGVTPNFCTLKPGAISCKECSITFLDEKSRRMHLMSAHGFRKRKHGVKLDGSENDNYVKRFGHEKLWQCKVCESVFNSNNALALHHNKAHSSDLLEVVQQKETLQECDQCDEAFIHKYELDQHKETHL